MQDLETCIASLTGKNFRRERKLFSFNIVTYLLVCYFCIQFDLDNGFIGEQTLWAVLSRFRVYQQQHLL